MTVIVSLILLLGLASGFWLGLIGLAKGRRDAAWWLMVIATFLMTVGPVVYAYANWMVIQSIGAVMSSGSGSGSVSGLVASTAGTSMMIAGALGTICGILLFSIGFALHGHKTAGVIRRAAELEELAASMSEEIHQLRGGNSTR